MLGLFNTLSLSLSLSLSSLYDRRHRPLNGNISYEGSGMIPGYEYDHASVTIKMKGERDCV